MAQWDEQDTRALFENISATRLKYIFGNNKTVIIGEAQRIEDIGIRLKLSQTNCGHSADSNWKLFLRSCQQNQ